MNEKGQSLLEVTIAIGIAVIILSTMTVITLTGLKNSQFAQNQTAATKLAQDGLEQVRATRDQNMNGSICLSNSASGWSNYNWTDLFNGTGGFSCAITSCNFVIRTAPPFCGFGGATSCPGGSANCIYLKQTNQPDALNGKFSRIIIIQDYGSTTHQKQVTSRVTWNDTAGSHQVNLSTILADPNTQTPVY